MAQEHLECSTHGVGQNEAYMYFTLMAFNRIRIKENIARKKIAEKQNPAEMYGTPSPYVEIENHMCDTSTTCVGLGCPSPGIE